MTEILYKVTDGDGYTQRGGPNRTRWEPGQWIEVPWGGKLCQPGCLHAYRDPLLAALFDPVDALLLPAGRLWIAEGNVRLEDAGKCGCDRMRALNEHEVPVVSFDQRKRWAIYCAREVYRDPRWQRWAKRWLSGEDRSAAAADATRSADYSATYSASAAYLATSAAYAAYAADAASAVHAAARAADWDWHKLLELALKAIVDEPEPEIASDRDPVQAD